MKKDMITVISVYGVGAILVLLVSLLFYSFF